jgi:REP element-mobilizing transposase RayT
MLRKPRIEFHGALYHVIIRGNQRQKVFKEPADYQKKRLGCSFGAVSYDSSIK